MTKEEYESRSIPRLQLLDSISPLCEWDKWDFEISYDARQKRERWKKLMDEQCADEVAFGL